MKNRTHVILCEDSFGIVAKDEEGEIQAMCMADTFSVDACCVHLAIDNPYVLKYGFFQEVAQLLFIQKKRERLFGLVPDNNEKAIKLDKHIGFKEVTRIPDALMDGIGYIVMRMDKNDCRWLEEVPHGIH